MAYLSAFPHAIKAAILPTNHTAIESPIPATIWPTKSATIIRTVLAADEATQPTAYNATFPAAFMPTVKSTYYSAKCPTIVSTNS